MAIKAVTVVISEEGDWVVTWAAAVDTDTGKPVRVPYGVYDLTVQCPSGTIGTSSLQGSLDGTNWGALGAGLAIAASARVDAVAVPAMYIRPTFGASASAAVVVVAGKTRR